MTAILVSQRARLVIVLVGVLTLAASLGAQRSAAAPPPMTLNVNVNGALEVVLGNGTRLRTSNAPGAVIPPGPYMVIVASDVPDSEDVYHMFHLFGPGVSLSSELLPCENPAPVLAVTLQPSSSYTYEDSRHPDITHVVFSTSAGGSSADTAGAAWHPSTAKATGSVANSSVVGSGITKLRGALVGAISSAGKPTLSLNGKGVSSLKAGRYKLTIEDKTTKGGFTIGQLHKPSLTVTSRSFVGRRTVMLTLRTGRWLFYSSAAAKRDFVVVA
jgi:hypothetical protein